MMKKKKFMKVLKNLSPLLTIQQINLMRTRLELKMIKKILKKVTLLMTMMKTQFFIP